MCYDGCVEPTVKKRVLYAIIALLVACVWAFQLTLYLSVKHGMFGALQNLSVLRWPLLVFGATMLTAAVLSTLSMHYINRKRPEIERIAEIVDGTYAFARQNIDRFKRRARLVRVLTSLYITGVTTALFALPLAAALFGHWAHYVLSLLHIPAIAICVTLVNTERLELGVNELKKHDFPQIFALIETAAHLSGVHGKFTAAVTEGCDVSVGSINGTYTLFIGIEALMLLSDKEMAAVFLHEMAHIKHRDTQTLAVKNRLTRFFKSVIEDKSRLFRMMYFFLLYGMAAVFSQHFRLYAACVALSAETAADELVKTTGGGQDFINAAAKLRCMVEYNFGLNPPFYADEDAPRRYYTDKIARFKVVYRQKSEQWLAVCRNALAGPRHTHPSLSERIAFMGADIGTLDFCICQDAYAAEVSAAVGFMDTQFWVKISRGYAMARRREFLPYEKAAKRGEHLSAERLNDMDYIDLSLFADAHIKCGRYEKALMLFDRALSIKPDHAFSLYKKGFLLIKSYDPRGFEPMRRAIELEPEYADIGGELLLAGYLRQGRQDEERAARKEMLHRLQEKLNRQFSQKKKARLQLKNTGTQTSRPAAKVDGVSLEKLSSLAEASAVTERIYFYDKDGETRVALLFNAPFMTVETEITYDAFAVLLEALGKPAPVILNSDKKLKTAVTELGTAVYIRAYE